MDTTSSEVRDRADMGALAGGRDEALDGLMDRHGPAVLRFLCRMLGNADDADDLAQETFVRVYRARASFKPEQRFSTWLFTIAANLARNQLRWRLRHPNLSLDSTGDTGEQSLADVLPNAGGSPSEEVSKSERTLAVRAAVQALPDDLREAILLCEWEDLAVADAAAVLKTTPKAVESRLYRARNLLRRKLERWL